MMKKLFLFLILFAPMSLFAQKFGHIDSQALLQSLPEAKIIQADLEVKGKQYDKQIAELQAELQRKAEEYDRTKSTMNATKQAETEKMLQEMYTKVQQTVQDNQKAFNEEQQRKLGPILDKVRKAIETVAKAGGYVYIMEKSAGQPLYINNAFSKDITAEVKLQLSKMSRIK